ncbi:MAG TPA: hypothetical protein PK402_04155 [Tepidisphaeraceae bacterium]|nr:hypothetical protein [Tepidisphaeraceae bacterium]
MLARVGDVIERINGDDGYLDVRLVDSEGVIVEQLDCIDPKTHTPIGKFDRLAHGEYSITHDSRYPKEFSNPALTANTMVEVCWGSDFLDGNVVELTSDGAVVEILDQRYTRHNDYIESNKSRLYFPFSEIKIVPAQAVVETGLKINDIPNFDGITDMQRTTLLGTLLRVDRHLIDDNSYKPTQAEAERILSDVVKAKAHLQHIEDLIEANYLGDGDKEAFGWTDSMPVAWVCALTRVLDQQLNDLQNSIHASMTSLGFKPSKSATKPVKTRARKAA